MLEKTPLAQQEFDYLYKNETYKLRKEIEHLKEKIEELRNQIKWLEQENAKHL